MRRVKQLLVALAFVTPVLGCGKAGKVDIKDATPEQVAQQEAALKDVGASEAEHRKKTPKEKTQQESVEDAERAHNRQQGR